MCWPHQIYNNTEELISNNEKTQSIQEQEFSMLMEVVHWFHICVMGIHIFRQTVNETCNFYRKGESHNMKH